MKPLIRQLTLGIVMGASGVVNAATFTVDSLANSLVGGVGLDTGISLAAGDVFEVTADPNDLWSAGALPRWSNADGLTGPRFATGTDDSGASAGTLIGDSFGALTQSGLSAPYGALVGEVSGVYFLLGTNHSGPAPADGTLRLYFWDINNQDNSGGILVDVQPVPLPPALGLLGMGITWLFVTGRRGRRSKAG